MTFTTRVRNTEKYLQEIIPTIVMTGREFRRHCIEIAWRDTQPISASELEEMRTRREESEYSHSEGAHRD